MSKPINESAQAAYENGWLRIYQDGSACVAYDADAYEGGECTIPAPGMSELQIEARVELRRRAIWMQGMWIERTWRKRNEVFDPGKERTTTMIRFRVCRSATEAEFVVSKVNEIVREMAGIIEDNDAEKNEKGEEDGALEAATPSI